MNDPILDDNPAVRSARRQVATLRGFYRHLALYLAVNIGLALLNLITEPNRLWFGWAAFGWGIGLLAHAARIFVLKSWLGPEWEQRKIRAILDQPNRD